MIKELWNLCQFIIHQKLRGQEILPAHCHHKQSGKFSNISSSSKHQSLGYLMVVIIEGVRTDRAGLNLELIILNVNLYGSLLITFYLGLFNRIFRILVKWFWFFIQPPHQIIPLSRQSHQKRVQIRLCLTRQ